MHLTDMKLMRTALLTLLCASRLFAQGGTDQFQTHKRTETGAIARTVAAKLGDALSVKDFGATGDGATDDAAAINAAEAAAHSIGACVHFPVGIYAIASPLDYATDENMCWQGDAGMKILATANMAAVLSFGTLGTPGDGNSYVSRRVTLEGITVDGAGHAVDGFVLRLAVGFSMRNSRATNVSGAGLRCGQCTTGVIDLFTVSRGVESFTTVPANGIVFENQSANVTVLSPKIEGVSGAGILITGQQGIVIEGGTSEDNGIGVDVKGNYNSVSGLDMEANTTADIILRAGAVFNAFYHNLASSPGVPCLVIETGAVINSFHGGLFGTAVNISGINNDFYGSYFIGNITLGADSGWNSFHGGAFQGTFTDGGTKNRTYGFLNLYTGQYVPDSVSEIGNALSQTFPAPNGALTPAITSTMGADATLGPMVLSSGAYLSATGSQRYGYLGIGDGRAVRPLALNTLGSGLFGPVLVGGTTDDTANKLQVTGGLKTDNLTITGAFNQSNPSAPSNTSTIVNTWSLGTPSLVFMSGGHPSSTASSRYGFLGYGDVSGMRPLLLNSDGNVQGSGAHFGPVLMGSSTNDGTHQLQVAGGAVIDNLTVTGTSTITLPDTGTPGTYAKVTTDVKGRVTAGANLATSDLPALPAPTALTFGGVKSAVPFAHQFLTGVGVTGIFSQAQPTPTDVGLGNVPNVDATNAGNIASGTLPAARLPYPTASTLGGVQSLGATTSKWIDSISTAGVPHASQPTAADVGLGNVPNVNATVASNITSGTLPAARLPNPTAFTLGGIQSWAPSASKWIDSISTSGVPHSSQPTPTDVGLGSVTNDAQLKAASNLADVPNKATARSNLGLSDNTNLPVATLNAIGTAVTGSTSYIRPGGFGLPAGVYRVAFYANVTSPATAGSIVFGLTWNDGTSTHTNAAIGSMAATAGIFTSGGATVYHSGAVDFAFVVNEISIVGTLPHYSFWVTFERLM